MNALVIAGQTDVGQRRTDNQDTFVCSPIWSEHTALLAAIDGVGGYAGGDRAAGIAKESVTRRVVDLMADPNVESSRTTLYRLIENPNAVASESERAAAKRVQDFFCLLYTSPSPRDS